MLTPTKLSSITFFFLVPKFVFGGKPLLKNNIQMDWIPINFGRVNISFICYKKNFLIVKVFKKKVSLIKLFKRLFIKKLIIIINN